MFNVLARPTFTRTVKVQFPDGDSVSEQTFKATFKWLPSDELEAFHGDSTEDVKNLLRAVVLSGSEIVDDEGKELPWSAELLEQLLGWSNVRMALLLTFNTAWAEEKRGN